MEEDEMRESVLRYLEKPRAIEKQIRRKKEKIRDLRSSLVSISVNYSDMPRSPSGPVSRMKETMVKIVDLEDEIRGLEGDKVRQLEDMTRTISRLKEPDQKNVIYRLYVAGEPWKTVAAKTGCGLKKMSGLRNQGIEELGRLMSRDKESD